jgi:hypothetical protein
MLLNYRAELEEISHTVSFLLKRRDATMDEVTRLNGLMNEAALEGGSDEAATASATEVHDQDDNDKEEVAPADVPLPEVEDDFISA